VPRPNAFSPAAAWYFIVKVCRCFAPQGETTTYKELNMIGKQKSYPFYLLVVFALCARKNDQQKKIKNRCA
jgi:hypothetical protein